MVVYVLNFLSRQLPGILAKPIQDSLHVSDGQLGRIGGLYFALFYCLHLNSGRVARRQDEQVEGSGGGVCDLERVQRCAAAARQLICSLPSRT